MASAGHRSGQRGDRARSLNEAKQAEQEQKRVRERTVVIEKTHDHVRDEGDVWEL
jgi:hypothetical protein